MKEVNLKSGIPLNGISGRKKHARPFRKVVMDESILSEFAANNYWRLSLPYEVSALENEYA